MHSLFFRIFMLFWAAMALIVGGSIAITFTIAAREYEAPELQRHPSVAIKASEVLAHGGLVALKDWLSANRTPNADRDLYIIGPNGADILGRRLSQSAARRLAFFNRDELPPVGQPPGNFRPGRGAPQIVGADGSVYTVREIERLESLISQVLRLARLHGTDVPFARESFDIDGLIEEVVRDANFEGAVKNCLVRLEGAANATVNGNRDLLRSAIENVLRNAVRYSPEGVPIEVRATRLQSGLAIVIRDRGPGVPDCDLEHIFQPFYRVAESRDRDTGGEGIGLAITAQVMKAHGGSAKAANGQGGGFEVRLNLPVAVLAV